MPPETSPQNPSPWQPGSPGPAPRQADAWNPGLWTPGEEQDLDRTVSYRVPRPAPGEAHTVRMPSWTEPEEIGSVTLTDPPPLPRRTRRGRGWIVALVAAVFVGVVGGGGVWAAAKLSGGGAQPQDVLPADALAYVRLDLDPSAGQKLALFGIARKFSATRGSFAGDDPREALVTALRKNEPGLAEIDYARDVEPWLGDRVGLAVLPTADGGEPVGVLAVQVKDEAAARTGIGRLGLDDGAGGLAFRDGYAIVAASQKQADEYVKAAPLSGDPRFAADLTALGEQGVLSFWMDVEKIVKAAGRDDVATGPMLQQIKGMRFAAALRFSGDYAELAGITRGGTPTKVRPEPVRIGELPASTVAAASVSGLGDLLRERWPSVERAADGSGGEMVRQTLDGARAQYGLSLPDDLVTLLGRTFTLAVDEQDLDGPLPRVGAVLTTDTAKARDLVTRLQAQLNGTGMPAEVATAEHDGQFVIASTEEYAAALGTGGGLGESETFRTAVPDAGNATYAVYADLDRLEKLYLDDVKGEARADVEMLRAIGLSGTHGQDGTSFTLRLIFN
ncbi:DUF3352 domain-containing protein [Microbispora sp. H11081]|uniref:DUF3352 domain-containing protein n=1 Tax=Microbispora sp. H11081 TaxID=2729107 RepID=UPI0014754C01|nr:DUF3352 domain-containing protein [Microbispora sp. H11081]